MAHFSEWSLLCYHFRGSQVSGTGGWGHLASGVGGVLEHWAMAFTPGHAIINIAIDKVIRNMAQPYDPNGKEKKGDASHTIATTGPGRDHSTPSPNSSQPLAYHWRRSTGIRQLQTRRVCVPG